MNNLTLALAGIGGYVIYEMASGDAVARPPSLPTSTNKDVFSTTNGLTVKPLVSNVKAANARSAVASFAGIPRNKMLFGSPMTNGQAMQSSKASTSASKQLVDQATAKVKSEYKKLTNEARKAGAKKLNEILNPSPGLTGKETFEEASKKIGKAVGATAGGALGASFGPIGASLGAMAGAYLGAKLGPEIAKAWNDLEEHFANAYDDVRDAIDDSASKAGNAVKDFVGSIF